MLRLRELTGEEQLALDATLGLQVSPSQFFGIEVEEWPARIAETAIFLVDHQLNLELARDFGEAPEGKRSRKSRLQLREFWTSGPPTQARAWRIYTTHSRCLEASGTRTTNWTKPFWGYTG